MRKIRKGDTVVILTGKDKDTPEIRKIGKVLRVVEDGKRVVVEKINVVKRHTKPKGQNREGGILEKEAPIDISNVALISPTTGKPVRVAFKTVENAQGKAVKVRYVHKTGELLDPI